MYRAPLKELQFVLHDLIGDAGLQACPDLGDYSPDLADSVLAEAGRFAESVLDPLYRSGDRDGAKCTPQGVVTPPGFKEAYAKFVEGGWPSLSHSPEFGGQGMPRLLGTAVEEMWASANSRFKLCPMLTHSAIEALEQVGTPAQQQAYLPKLVSGEWTGTMNLTEPQAGSDLAQMRTRAVPDGDHYRLFGQKIFITYGEHDFTPNIVHLVLARIDGAPAGVKGISLFVVPKFLPEADGSPGERNDVHCLSIEHKLGIHASPDLRHGVRREGRRDRLSRRRGERRPQVHVHHDERRAALGRPGGLRALRARVPASRGMGAHPHAGQAAGRGGRRSGADHPPSRRQAHAADDEVAHRGDAGAGALRRAACSTSRERHPDEDLRAKRARRAATLLIPIVKGWCTESGIELTSLGHPGSRRHGLRRGDRRGAAPIATCASLRSTKARPASRRTI